MTIGADLAIVEADATLGELLCQPGKALRGLDFTCQFTNPDAARVLYTRAFAGGVMRGCFLQLRRPSGELTPLLCNSERQSGERVRVIMRDLTGRSNWAVSQRDRQPGKRYRLAFECTDVGFALADLEGNIFEVNPVLSKIFGISAERMECMKIGDLIHPEDAEAIGIRQLQARAAAGSSWIEKRFLDVQGRTLYMALSCVMARNEEGHPLYLVISFRDVSERRLLNARLEEEASQDALTRALTRNRFEERCVQELQRASRHQHRLTLVMADLDRFKLVNDQHGHDAGDHVLREFAEIVRRCQRTTDIFGRWGGEEFLILLPDTGIVGAEHVAERIRNTLEKAKFSHGGCITASFGVSSRRPGENFAGLLKRTDAALYLAKEEGRNRVAVDQEDRLREPVPRERSFHEHLLHWKRSYACGDPAIDSQHRGLFQTANRILMAMEPLGDPNVLVEGVDHLLADVVLHFSEEEQILEQCRYPELEEHRACHRQLLEQAGELAALFKAHKSSAGALLGFVVHDVVARHMLHEDRKYHPWVVAATDRTRKKARLRGLLSAAN